MTSGFFSSLGRTSEIRPAVSGSRLTLRPPGMKFLLTLHMNPTLWATLTDEQKNGVYEGHGAFIELISGTGEMVETKALAEPSETKTVRVKDGATEVDKGAFVESDAFLCGYYVVDVESEERAVELAAMIPDARYTAVEVRKIVHEG